MAVQGEDRCAFTRGGAEGSSVIVAKGRKRGGTGFRVENGAAMVSSNPTIFPKGRNMSQPLTQGKIPGSVTSEGCAHCGASKGRSRDTYCSVRCQKDQQHKNYINLWIAGEITGLKADNVLSGHVRRHLISMAQNRCNCSGCDGCRPENQCSWSAVHPVTGLVPLEIDHVDGDWRNSRPENLKVLCPNCHALTPTYRALNKGNGRPRVGATAR
jgi:hypothetical protein